MGRRKTIFQRPLAALGSLLASIGTRFPLPEQQRDAPDSRQADQNIDDAAENGSGAAEQPRHQVKLKQADQPPVQAADDGQHQRDLIHDHKNPSLFEFRTWSLYTPAELGACVYSA